MSVSVERDGRVVLVTIQRPEAMNAVNGEVMDGLEEVVSDLEGEDGAAAVVLTGAGERAFSAGGDIQEWQERMTPDGGRRSAARMHSLLDRLESLPVATIAAVNGYAIGGGCELALACDIRLASRNAAFIMTEISLGLIPGWGGCARLPRMVGYGPALDMILSGEPVGADRALEMGLVSRVTEQENLLEEASTLARRISSYSPLAVRLAKKAVRDGLEMALPEAKKLEVEYFGQAWGTPEHTEAINSFLARKKKKGSGLTK